MLDEQQNVEPQIEQIDEVEAEIETKSSGMPLWVWIAGGAVLITALVLIICGAKGVFGSKSTSKKPSNPKADGERRASAAQANNDISAAPVKGEPKKKEEGEEQLATSEFALSDYATPATAVTSGVALATLFGIYKYFAGETVVIEEEPHDDIHVTPCVDENGAVVVCGSQPYTPTVVTDFDQAVADCEEAATGTCGVTDDSTDAPPVGPVAVYTAAAAVATVAVLGGLYVFYRKYIKETAVVDDEDADSVATRDTASTEHTTDDDDTHHTPSVVVTVDTPTDVVDEPVVVDPIHLDAETYVVVNGHLYKVPGTGDNSALERQDGVEEVDADPVAYAAGQGYLLPHAHFDVTEEGEGETGAVTTTYVVQDVVSTVVKSGGMSGSSGNSTRVNTVHALPVDPATGQVILESEASPMQTFPFADVCQNQIKRETETIQ